MAYTLPMASPFNTCWSSSVRFTRRGTRGGGEPPRRTGRRGQRAGSYFTKTNVPLVPSGSILICATYDCFCTISPPMPGPVENEISPSGVS